MFNGGQLLRLARLDRCLTSKDVQSFSEIISKRSGDTRYIVLVSDLTAIETGDAGPTIFNLQSLCEIYELDFHRALASYGVLPFVADQNLRYSKSGRPAPRRVQAGLRLLSEMTQAAHSVYSARGRRRLLALKRYSLVLRRFTNLLLLGSGGSYAGSKKTTREIAALRSRREERTALVNRKLAAVSATRGLSLEACQPLRPPHASFVLSVDRMNAPDIRGQVLAALTPYVGTSQASQLLDSVADNRDLLGQKAGQLLGAFLGRTAGSRLANRILNSAVTED